MMKSACSSPARAGYAGVALVTFVLAMPARAADDRQVKVQPDALHFGTVRQGAIAEGSVRVLMKGDSADGIDARAEAPAFLKVLDVKTGTHTYSNLGSRVYCDVMVAVDTEKVGNFAGLLRLHVGGESVSPRVTVTVAPRAAESIRILVANTPFEKFSTSDSHIFDTWKEIVETGNLDPDYLDLGQGPVLRNLDLSQYDVIFLSGGGIVGIHEEDYARLKDFIVQGGHVVIAASHFMGGSVPKANRILAECGLQMRDSELQDEVVIGKAKDLPRSEFTEGVTSLRVHRLTPVKVEEGATATYLIKGAPDGEGFAALGRFGKGSVVALGVPLWWSWIAGERATNADNARFLQNVLSRTKAR
ncbi:MAG TPA: hypothetical protein VGG64_20395 [Pirellulales bacterium]|jgi:hypothetical protein